MRLLKDLGVSGLLSEYFSNLKSTEMGDTSQENIVNFLLMISEQKQYRPYIINRGIIEFLKKIFDQHGGSKVKIMKEKEKADPSQQGRFLPSFDKSYERLKEKID
jgi:hypothetical protein